MPTAPYRRVARRHATLEVAGPPLRDQPREAAPMALLAVMRVEGARRMLAGEDAALSGARAIESGDLAAIVMPPPAARTGMVRGVLRGWHRILVGAAAAGDVLPAMPLTRLAGPDAVIRLLAARPVGEALDTLQGFIQRQVRVDGTADLLQRQLRGSGVAGDHSAGPPSRRAMEPERARVGAGLALSLAERVERVAGLPLEGDWMLVNAACLTARADDAGLVERLHAIDSAWSGALAIRLSPPLPAISFVALHADPGGHQVMVATPGTLDRRSLSEGPTDAGQGG